MIRPIKSRKAREFSFENPSRPNAGDSLHYCQVYALITESVGEWAYVKIGISRAADARAAGIQTSCPIPIKKAFVAWVPDRKSSWGLEAYLHVEFERFHTTREWFKFPADSVEATIPAAMKEGGRQICGVIDVEPVLVEADSAADAERHRKRHRGILAKYATQRIGDSDCYIVGDQDASKVRIFHRKRLLNM